MQHLGDFLRAHLAKKQAFWRGVPAAHNASDNSGSFINFVEFVRR